MSELKVYVKPLKTNMFGKTIVGQSYYLKSEADKVIAEKDAQILDLIEQVQKERSAKVDYKISANDLSDGLKKAYEEIRRLKRALWLARAERAKDGATTCNDFAYLGDTERDINMTLARTWMKCRMLKPSEWSKVWNNVERKCRAKAEQYK